MNEHEREHEPQIRPASKHDIPDWRRLDVARGSFMERIANGIARATTEHTEIDDRTARCIAHVLGRAYGRDSYLAEFGRTGEGNYLAIRDEYLYLYNDKRGDTVTEEWIDWFGTYLVQREQTGSGRRFMNEHLPPKLNQLLVRTRVRISGNHYVVQIPATWDSGEIDGLIEMLTKLHLAEDPALQAFLSLPDVSVSTGDIMHSFHEAFAGAFPDAEAALRALSPYGEWEQELTDWCIDRGIEAETLEWNLAPLLERLADLYDLVERNGTTHAFIK